jgi:hypothetical protein
MRKVLIISMIAALVCSGMVMGAWAKEYAI